MSGNDDDWKWKNRSDYDWKCINGNGDSWEWMALLGHRIIVIDPISLCNGS